MHICSYIYIYKFIYIYMHRWQLSAPLRTAAPLAGAAPLRNWAAGPPLACGPTAYLQPHCVLRPRRVPAAPVRTAYCGPGPSNLASLSRSEPQTLFLWLFLQRTTPLSCKLKFQLFARKHKYLNSCKVIFDKNDYHHICNLIWITIYWYIFCKYLSICWSGLVYLVLYLHWYSARTWNLSLYMHLDTYAYM